jgi:glutamate racemase
VIEQACPLFVPLVEEGMVDDPITEMVAKKYLTDVLAKDFKTVILGCTHYPVIKQDLKKVLGPDVALVESGDVLALKLEHLFNNQAKFSANSQRKIRVCITDLTDHFERLAHHLMHPIEIESLEKIVL